MVIQMADDIGNKALERHEVYRGKIQMLPKVPVRGRGDLSIWYTPGVAEPCKAIKEDPEKVYEYTNKGNTVAVVSDATRILGLGDIGPLAGLPVMEGKSLLFKHFGGVDAVPIMLDTKNPDKFIETVKLIAPSFGGINLEDISSPKCFYILDRLRKELDIPVWHDDQQGTATVVLAAVLNALKIVGKKLEDVVIASFGAGAAGYAVMRLLVEAGVNPGNIRVVEMVNREPTVLHQHMDLARLFPYRGCLLRKTNRDNVMGGPEEALRDADILISFTRPGPGVIKKEWIKLMNDDAIVFPLANPVPEILPGDAKEAGARIVGTGRSDYPNQINNSLGFPGIFRGALDVHATTITDGMAVAAAHELAKVGEEEGLSEDHVLPTMDDWDVFAREAAAVAIAALEEGVARKYVTWDEEYERARKIIKLSRDSLKILMDNGIIKEV
ncbi:malic enzyme [Aciduliprofundum sp. MAR08-339]|nr:malic enzyme [Aciduliprofundum sp. MAR08-339]